MSRLFKYIDNMPNVTESLPDIIMEGDSSMGLSLIISNNTTEIAKAPIEIITVSSSEDDPDNPGVDVPALSAAEVSESSGDEGGNDLDKGKPEKDKPQKGDYRVNPEDVPDLEDESEEEDEFTQIWGKLCLQPDKGQIAIVKENWRKIKGRIEVLWQDLRQVIIDAFKE